MHGLDMTFDHEIYGHDRASLLTSPEEVYRRLEAILSDKVLRFNPYKVDDATLLACVERARWRPWPALTQMLVFHFHDIRRVKWKCPYDAIFYHIGDQPDELHMSINVLTRRVTYTSTLHQIHTNVGDRVLTNIRQVERMQGKDYFVSHYLPARFGLVNLCPAYRMYRLKGNDAQKAEIIRHQMVESKITMLKEILSYPYTRHYLNCSRNYIDYTTPINSYIEAFRHYPDASR